MERFIKTLIKSIDVLERSPRSELNTGYDNGYIDGEHDTYIDILDSLGVNHDFKKYIPNDR